MMLPSPIAARQGPSPARYHLHQYLDQSPAQQPFLGPRHGALPSRRGCRRRLRLQRFTVFACHNRCRGSDRGHTLTGLDDDLSPPAGRRLVGGSASGLSAVDVHQPVDTGQLQRPQDRSSRSMEDDAAVLVLGPTAGVDENPDASGVQERELAEVEPDRVWHRIERLVQNPTKPGRGGHVELAKELDGHAVVVGACVETCATQSGGGVVGRPKNVVWHGVLRSVPSIDRLSRCPSRDHPITADRSPSRRRLWIAVLPDPNRCPRGVPRQDHQRPVRDAATASA